MQYNLHFNCFHTAEEMRCLCYEYHCRRIFINIWMHLKIIVLSERVSVSEVVVQSFSWQLLLIDPGKAAFFSIINMMPMICGNNWIHFDPKAVSPCLHITLSQSFPCRHIWRQRTHKILRKFIQSSMCLKLRPCYQLSFMQHMRLCFQRIHYLFYDCKNVCISSYYHHQSEI